MTTHAISLSYNSYQYFFNLLSLAPITLILYYLTDSPFLRRTVLTLSGMYLLSFIAPRFVLFYLFFWLEVFFIHRYGFIRDEDKNEPGPLRKGLCILAWVSSPFVVLPLLLWKVFGDGFTYAFTDYSSHLLAPISTKLWEIDMTRSIVIPLGISFSTFRAIDLLIKTYLEKIPRLQLDQVLFYGFFPPVQVFGPITEYEDVAQQTDPASPSFFLYGLLRLASGFLKVFVIASLLHPHVSFVAVPKELPVWLLWLKLLGYYWYVYMNFGGYSDMAIGSAALFGFHIKENFNFPFLRTNISDFWNSWHISLSHWARRNVYMPAGGLRPQTQYRALYYTMMAIALWHSIGFATIIFGLYHGTLLALHRFCVNKYGPFASLAKAQNWQRYGFMFLTYIAVCFSLPLIFLPQASILGYYMALFGGRG
jgi:D-alanyl-lipoteichoic acid acyltransferase DltB (MBOAT superfamily)